jgi:hypothetical protein
MLCRKNNIEFVTKSSKNFPNLKYNYMIYFVPNLETHTKKEEKNNSNSRILLVGGNFIAKTILLNVCDKNRLPPRPGRSKSGEHDHK